MAPHKPKPPNAQLVIMAGLPGSGKSFIAEEYRKNGYSIISTDAIRVEVFGDVNTQSHNQQVFAIAEERVKTALSQGAFVVVDATNLLKFRRERWKALAAEFHASCTTHWVETSVWKSIWRNIRYRKQRGRFVPIRVILKMARGMERDDD